MSQVRSQEYRTLFLQELLRRGVLGQSFVVSAAHTDTDIELTADAVREKLRLIAGLWTLARSPL